MLSSPTLSEHMEYPMRPSPFSLYSHSSDMSLLLSGLVPYLAKLGLGTHCAYQLLWSYWGCVNLDTLTLGSRMLRSNGYFPECDQQLTTSQLPADVLWLFCSWFRICDSGEHKLTTLCHGGCSVYSNPAIVGTLQCILCCIR